MWPWRTTPLSFWGIFVAIAQKYIVCVKMIDFTFMPKIIRILSNAFAPWKYLANVLP